MKKSTLLLAASLLPLLSACNSIAPNSAAASVATTPEAAWVGEARQVAGSVPPKLMAVLKTEMQQGGPAHAIGVCQVVAPNMAQAASQATGWQIRRVSLGNRNPKAVPDSWERQTLETFERQQAAGADASKLERAEVVTENGQQVKRYMRALPVQEACLQCHGTADKLGPGVAARLSERYPHDKGTGYLLGQVRGAMTLRQNVQ
ncbi:Tll0287-like domain-containing protein [Malikia spinosa]|jgi:hypothetical protein|uniref:DUF3365 domain-containing protein n=1 Tax=Malikia spinosa TaxID=86180 RepID=A0A2S9KEJ4_9BURK|nr:DUF3365 domain-containing protein [Malikia spinosa]MYZ52413.1 DUF3365 domain-containing protein [Malikia spinosa]OGB71578.1 MAG: hypothetical protein A2486_06435 [Burkholderiales bacterium RIFOXYC12_FULL_65_23]PRD68870.1 hypothetical protein C6P61_09065 [Malikia spinosa]